LVDDPREPLLRDDRRKKPVTGELVKSELLMSEELVKSKLLMSVS